MQESPHVSECSTTFTERKRNVCACGCGEEFGPTYTGRNRFKRRHYVFLPDQHVVDPETGDWIWTGPVNKAGEPIAKDDRGSVKPCRRLYYEKLVRPLGSDEIVEQDPEKCRNQLCCNPEHQRIIRLSDQRRQRATCQWERQKAAVAGEHHIGPKPVPTAEPEEAGSFEKSTPNISGSDGAGRIHPAAAQPPAGEDIHSPAPGGSR